MLEYVQVVPFVTEDDKKADPVVNYWLVVSVENSTFHITPGVMFKEVGN